MSYTAFRHFLKGGKPQPKTREKLVVWYATLRAGRVAGVKKEDVAAALTLLNRYVAEGSTAAVREERRRELLDGVS